LGLFTEWGHEEVVVLQDAASGLRGVVAIHDSQRGPALSATRLRPAASLDEALAEALRLSRAITREAAVAGLPHGGAAAVLVGEAAREKSRGLLSAYARFLDRMSGRIRAAGDSGFEPRDLAVLSRMSRHVVHRPGPGPDAADLAAQAVAECIRETAAELGTTMAELHVAVQGLGQVGYRTARLLRAEGARLTVADPDLGRVERAQDELQAAVSAPGDVYAVEADVFSPNACGPVLDAAAVDGLRARAVVGAARAALADPGLAEILRRRGVLYAPDSVVCAGGLAASLAAEEMEAQERLAEGASRLRAVFRRSREDGVSTLRAAEDLAGGRAGSPR
jgi:leucine dehydrogenase